ncbi:radical SAM family heme chaperone HemW [Saliterribacillus persicus]|uniref:Heme chaperone HemW n=1 Tax=Saliterribacillus persicus TaxID=930114 RepID=A0A368XFQ5_9BACI|nr:radical SAM family heme chaperone HemW [Saliterribacillus persicus]RCW65317.1 anaerobic coproporphyrinogen III oxidase [Saliterribacillus persicus]
MVQSVYIHIPFCEKICHYCDFVKFFYEEKMADEYLEALEKELKYALPAQKQYMKTIFVGGGTPTALNTAQLKKLVNMIDHYFDVANCEEYSFEANPGDLDAEKISILKHAGVNRISMGVQVFDDVMLEELGRLHRIKDVYQNVNDLKKSGIDNVSIDLMYSLPNQSFSNFEKTLEEALSFQLPHYSAYSLQIEPKTIFYQRYKKGSLTKPPEEVEAQMYEHLRTEMNKRGVKQYEISNFALPGYESKHNLTYWNNNHYYGFGAGAHGYLGNERIINIRPFPGYVKAVHDKGSPILHREYISKKEQIEEEMFLGLRKMEGVSLSDFYDKYRIPMLDIYKKSYEILFKKGWIVINNNKLQLTDSGMLFGNEVFQEFLLDDKIFESL